MIYCSQLSIGQLIVVLLGMGWNQEFGSLPMYIMSKTPVGNDLKMKTMGTARMISQREVTGAIWSLANQIS